jgi:hypothetical protein
MKRRTYKLEELRAVADGRSAVNLATEPTHSDLLNSPKHDEFTLFNI